MSERFADHNLLFGILAVQMDFIDRDQLIAAMNRWLLEKDKPLGQILVDDGALQRDTRQLVDALTDKHLSMHGDDAEQSLQHVSAVHLDAKQLESIEDDDIRNSLLELTASHASGADKDQLANTLSVGESTSQGQRFRILRPHAEGGLGEVYVARDEELNREVALKQIRQLYADDPDSRSRFTVEAEITGRLEHPNIVPVYGLGCHRSGRPFYAMRLVHGESLKEAAGRLHRAADNRGLAEGPASVEFRKLLACFINVCNAIEYAHSRGIVHRDIKPSNIMLGKYGETLVVDWGLAKPIDSPESSLVAPEPKLRPSSGSHSTPTQMGSAIGTPAYMSPEQAFGHVDRIAPTSDVYCLGATLYYLLSGQPPVTDKKTGTVLRKVQSGDFPRPREVRRDSPAPLEAICLRAMAVNSEDRYPSARLLGEDIERWLADEPVSAYDEPLSVRTRRWVRRHQSAVTGGAATVMVALASSAVGILMLSAKNQQLLEANRRENQANVELSRARDVADQRFEIALDSIDDYYTGVSEELLLEQPGLRELRTSLLARPLEFYQRLQDELDGDPHPRAQAALARAYSKIAEITADVGSKDKALEAHQQAIELLERLAAEDPVSHRPQLAQSYNLLGILQRVTGDRDGALASYRKAIEIRELLAAGRPDSPATQDDVAESYNNLGNLQRDLGQEAEAVVSYRHAIEIRELLETEHEDVAVLQAGLARCYNNLGVVLRGLGDSAGAIAAYQQAIRRRVDLVEKYPERLDYQDDLASTYNNLSAVQRIVGESDQSIETSQKSIEIRQRLVNEQPNVIAYQQGLAASYNNIGNLYRARGDTKAALEAYENVVAICQRLEVDNPNISEVRDNLARTYHNVGVLQNRIDQEDAAIESFKLAIEMRDALSKEHPKDHKIQNDLAQSCLNLGVIYRSRGAMDDALQQYQRAIGIRTLLVEREPMVADYQEDLAACYNNLGNLYSSMERTDEAVACFERSLQIQKQLVAKDPDNRDSHHDLARSYHNLGVVQRDADRQEEALESWQRAIETREWLVSESPSVRSFRADLLKTHRLRAALLHDMQRPGEAIPSWDRTIALAPDGQRAALRIRRAQTVAGTDDYQDAVKEVEELTAETERGERLFEAACVVSTAAATAASDTRLDPQLREDRARQYAMQVIQLLSTADKLDYFDDREHAEDLSQDARLDPIRDLDAFQELFEKRSE